jgi:hypothetical protein
MYDILPFPRVIGETPEEQIKELTSYLIQFKETLEFALTNITTENLSADLVKKLNGLGANIEQDNAEKESELAQISQRNPLTIYDVINSPAFESAVKNIITQSN